MSSRAFEASAHGSKRLRLSGPEGSKLLVSSSSYPIPMAEATPAANTSETESSLSSSSEEPSDDSSSSSEDDEPGQELHKDQARDGVVNLRANRGKKPAMKLAKGDLGPDIRPFLKEFLPQLKTANEDLEAQKKAGTLTSLDSEAGKDEEEYIQMELGLGVLEEKSPNAPSSDSENSDSEADTRTQDILAKLMGREDTGSKPGIEEVQENKDL